jgi:cytochrome c
MYKSYLKKIVSTSVVASVVLLGTACNASNDEKATEHKPVAKTVEKKVEATKSEAKAPAKTTATASNDYDKGTNPAKPQLSDSVKKTYPWNSKLVVDGGVYYPSVSGKRGAYYVNDAAHSAHAQYGKTATANEIKAWDIDIMFDGHGLPEGSGNADEGSEIYDEKCAQCHGDFGAGDGLYPAFTHGNAYEMQKTLTNQRVGGNDEGPKRDFGSYWPYASTAWWYIKTGMPHQAPMSLENDEVYSLVAYLLSINEIKIDGVEVDDEFELNKETFKKIVMPNIDGFEPKIRGPHGQDNSRAYFNNTANYGNGSKCMKNCIDGEPKVQRIKQAIADFSPALSDVRDLPAKKADAKPEHPGKKVYDKSCSLCHGTDAMGAPDVGNKAAWAKVMEQGIDAVYHNAINGKNGMPPKGGAMDLSDDEIKQVVDYMIEESK